MNLYRIEFDDQPCYVEAPSMGAAITLWQQHLQHLWSDPKLGTPEPESIVLVHDEAVIR